MVRRRGTLDLKHLKVLVLDEADNMLSQQALGDQSLMVKKSVCLYRSPNHDSQSLLPSASAQI